MPSTEATEKQSSAPNSRFPTAAEIFLGLGLGSFFDGIVLHQILQWHHMATSAGYRLPNAQGRKTGVKQRPNADIRTRGEIDREKYALKAALDFSTTP